MAGLVTAAVVALASDFRGSRYVASAGTLSQFPLIDPNLGFLPSPIV